MEMAKKGQTHEKRLDTLTDVERDKPTVCRLIDYRFGWIIKCYMSLSNPPHPTAQTIYSRDMKFGMESQWGNTFWAIRGFFQFPPLSRDMGVGRCNPKG